MLVTGLLAGCSAPDAELGPSAEDEVASTDANGGEASTAGNGSEGVATLLLEGTTHQFVDVADDGFGSLCRVLGASLQAGLIPLDDSGEPASDSGAILTLNLLDVDRMDDPALYDDPAVRFTTVDGEVWVAGGEAEFEGVDPSTLPVDIAADTETRTATGTVTLGLVDPSTFGAIQRSADAELSIECFAS
tara:strand:+ start:13234 stop:13803 length:570 start_codon:yes stop_codon:yes gene_type:complete